MASRSRTVTPATVHRYFESKAVPTGDPRLVQECSLFSSSLSGQAPPRPSLRLQKAFSGDWQALSQELDESNHASSIIRSLVNGDISSFDPRGVILSSPEDVSALMATLRSPFQESVKLLLLDDAYTVGHGRIISIGELDSTAITQREIIGEVVRLNERSGTRFRNFIISHNHPSGDPKPSDNDRLFTRLLAEAAQASGMCLRDHVITNGLKFFSFAENGLLHPSPDPNPKRKNRFLLDASLERKRPVHPGDQAPWEVIPRLQLAQIDSPSAVAPLADGLRAGSPSAAHIVWLSNSLRVQAVTRVWGNKQAPSLQQFEKVWMREGIAEGAAMAIIVMPDANATGNMNMDVSAYERWLDHLKRISRIGLVDMVQVQGERMFSIKQGNVSLPSVQRDTPTFERGTTQHPSIDPGKGGRSRS
jgi:hypothetical protein